VTRFDLRVALLPPGGSHACHDREWSDALVVVESGEVELECAGGSRPRFAAGATLALAGVSVRSLRNRGDAPAVLVAIARARPWRFAGRM
jgi:hypothetical protein